MSQKQVSFSPHLLIFDRKLDVALRDTHALGVISRFKQENLTLDDKCLQASMLAADIQSSADTWTCNQNILPSILKQIDKTPSLYQKCPWLPRICDLISESIQIQLDWLQHSVDQKLRIDSGLYADMIKTNLYKSSHFRGLCNTAMILEELVNLLPHSEMSKLPDESSETFDLRRGHSCKFLSKQLGMKIAWSRNTAAIEYMNDVHIFPRTYILLIHNKLSDIISMECLVAATPDAVYGQVDCLDYLRCFISELTRLAIQYGNKYFDIAKVLEALIIAETLISTEGRGNSGLLKTITESLEENVGYEYIGSTLQDLIIGATIPFRHELACLSKIMGHPFCNIKKGAEELQQKTTENLHIVPERVLEATRYAKEDFIRSYLHKHGRWPLVEFSMNVNPSLRSASLRQTDPRNQTHQQREGIIRLRDYDELTLLKIMEFDMVENILPHIKDRTISLLKNKVIRKYFDKDDSFKPDWKETRLLIFYLLNSQAKTDHLWYLAEYISGDWEQVLNYLVIRVVPKEKELKTAPRAFGCKTYEDRARGIIQELNVARFLEEYSDEQAMTPSELVLLRKLYSFRNLHLAYPGYTQVIINVDASAWNNRFRHGANAPILAETLDRLFATPIFSKTQIAYRNSLIYMPDMDKTYYWHGQEGGIEGLNQDTWVYTYVHQIKVCLSGIPFPYHILCKGDDLRVAVMIPPANLVVQTIESIKNDLMRRIAVVGAEFGHKIKVEDSYASVNYMTFSKTAHLQGVELPQTLRKIQKCYGANNAFMNTIDDYIASSFSNAHSASKVGPSPISCYITALFWMYQTIIAKDIDGYGSLSDHQLVAISLVPNLMGGFPVIYLHNFFVRAESDLLPPFLDLLKYTEHTYPAVHTEMMKFLFQPMNDPIESLTALMIDPYCLPLKRPTTAKAFIKAKMKRMLSLKSRNDMIKELFDHVRSDYMDNFLASMRSANVYNAKLMSSLYACTPAGLIEECLAKFESGRSMIDALIMQSSRKNGYRILIQAKKHDINAKMYRMQLLLRKVEDSLLLLPPRWRTMCSTECAEWMRNHWWGKRVEGITHPALQHFIKVGSVASFGTNQHAAYHHFEVFIDPFRTTIYPPPCFQLGKFTPYLGSTTGVGLGKPEVHIEAKNILATKIHSLLDLLKWTCMSATIEGARLVCNLPDIIIPLLEAYAGKPIATLEPFVGKRVISQTITHHTRSRQYKTSIVPNTLTNIYTHMQGNSFAHVMLEESLHHHRINFLHIFCHTVSLISLKLWGGEKPHQLNRVWAETTPCLHCMSPVLETPMVLRSTYLGPLHFTSITQLGTTNLKAIKLQLDTYVPLDYYVPDNPIAALSRQDAALGLIQHFINQSWRARQSLQDRYTGHHLTAAGLSMLRGWGIKSSPDTICIDDLRPVPILDIFHDVALLVFSHIVRTLQHVEDAHLITQLATLPSEELPWTPLLIDIANAGRLGELQRHLQRFTASVSNSMYDNPTSYSPIFGACCYWYCSSTQNLNTRLAYLSNLLRDDFVANMRARIDALKWHYIYKEFFIPYKSVNRTLDPILAWELGMAMIVACMGDELQETLDRLNTDMQRDAHVREVSLFGDLDDPRDLLAQWIDSPEDRSTYLVVLMHRYPQIPWMDFLRGMADYGQRAREVFIESRNRLVDLKVTIYKTDIVACTNRLRTGMDAHRIPRPEMFISHNNRLPVIRPRRTAGYMRINRFENASDMYALNDPFLVPFPEEWAPTLINERWLKRPLGINNISASRLVYLLQDMNVEVLPDHSTFTCLGDGYGGYTAVISSLTQHSKIVYNTYPNTAGIIPIPIIALEVAEKRHNVIDSSAMHTGHYDLTLNSTLEMLAENIDLNTVVTLDAEVFDKTHDSREDMLLNTAAYFINTTAPNGILILKFYIEEHKAILHVIAYLGPLVASSYIMRSSASALDGELYLVCQAGPQEATGGNLEQVYKRYPPAQVCGRLRNVFLRYMTDIQRDIGGTNRLSSHIVYERLVINVAKQLPKYGWSKLQEVTKSIVPQGLHNKGNRLLHVWCHYISEALRGQQEMLMNEILGDLQAREVAVYNTLKHCYVILHRYLQLTGFRHVFLLAEKGWPIYIARDMIVREYTRLMNEFPLNLQLTPVIEAHFSEPYLANHIKIDPFRQYCLGHRWGISALCIGRVL